jgi:hypothetical protein
MTSGEIPAPGPLSIWREAKNLSREQVEQSLGFPSGTILRMENEGTIGLPPNQLRKLAQLYEIEIDSLLEAIIQTQLAFQKGLNN